MNRLTREWVRKAEADYSGASQLQNSPEPVHVGFGAVVIKFKIHST